MLLNQLESYIFAFLLDPTGMPTNVSVNPAPAVPNALDISWVPPPIHERNGEIMEYKLRYRVRGGEGIPVTIMGKATSYRIEGDYTFITKMNQEI